MGRWRVPVRLAATFALASFLYLVVYRPLELHWGATPAEQAMALPGDEVAPRPIFNATRAVTIAAPPEEVWPWLVQIGYGRAGWYSALDWFDNGGVPSADRVVPELQHLAVGDLLPIWEGVGQTVIAVEPNRYLLTKSSRPEPDTWVWALEPTPDGQTRLLWRMRNATYDWLSPFGALQLMVDMGDFFFVRNILLGIKERAEGLPIESLAATTPQVALWFAAFLGFLASLVALVVRRDWLRPLAAVLLAAAVTLLLGLGMPPLWADAAGVLGLYAALGWLYRGRAAIPAGPRRPVPRPAPLAG